MTKYKAYPHELLNIYKRLVNNSDLDLALVEVMKTAPEKQGVTNIRWITIRKQIYTNTYILIFNQLHIPKEVKIEYCLERVEQYISVYWGVSNVKNMDTTENLAEHGRHVQSATKRTRTTIRKTAQRKFNAKTADKIIRLIQDLLTFIKRRKKNKIWNTRETWQF